MSTGKLSSATDRIVQGSDDFAKLAAIFANLEVLGPSDFNKFLDEDGDPLPLTRFLIELNRVTGDDEWLVEFSETDPDSARDMAAPADNYMRRVRAYLDDAPVKTKHEWASGYSADLANSLSEKGLGQAFLIVARSAFREKQLNEMQADVLDTVEFSWG